MTAPSGTAMAYGGRSRRTLMWIATHAAAIDLTLFETDRPNVVVETVKKAEEDDALIVRLYEAHGARGPAVLSSDLPVKRAWRCNGLEEHEAALTWRDGVTLDVRPFEIITLKLEM